MKTIESIQIWDNGQIKTASVLNTNAINILLNQNAYFVYALHSLNENGTLGDIVTSGQLLMNNDEYCKWTTDDYAWNFVANNLNLTITGDFTPPQNIEQSVENNPENL